MVSEFDLPCAECDTELVARRVRGPRDDAMTVAECPSCGGQYYPEQALDRI